MPWFVGLATTRARLKIGYPHCLPKIAKWFPKYLEDHKSALQLPRAEVPVGPAPHPSPTGVRLLNRVSEGSHVLLGGGSGDALENGAIFRDDDDVRYLRNIADRRSDFA